MVYHGGQCLIMIDIMVYHVSSWSTMLHHVFVFFNHVLSVITLCFSMPTFKTSFPAAPGSVRTAAGISHLRGGPQPTSQGIDANLDGN